MKKIIFIILSIIILIVIFLSVDSLAYDVNSDIDNTISFITSSNSFKQQLNNLSITVSDLPYYAIYHDSTYIYFCFSEFPIVNQGLYYFWTGNKIEGVLRISNNVISSNGGYNTDYKTPTYRLGNFNNSNYSTSFIAQTLEINYNMFYYDDNVGVTNTLIFSQNSGYIEPTLENISISTLPTTLEYYQGEEISMDGAVVMAYFDNGTSEIITDYTINPTTASGKGTQEVTVSYNDKTTTFDIIVYENQSSSILGRILNFFRNFFDNLLHFFVPTNEQIDALQQSFNTKISNKFSIQSWTFNSGDIDYGVVKPLEPPKLQFNILGSIYEFDTQNIIDFLNTPVSYGKSYGSLGVDMQIPTGGLTIYKLFSIFLSVDMFIANIYLYNKFFNKGGD